LGAKEIEGVGTLRVRKHVPGFTNTACIGIGIRRRYIQNLSNRRKKKKDRQHAEGLQETIKNCKTG